MKWIAAVVLASVAACAGSNAAGNHREPREPRDHDPGIEDRIRGDAAKTPEDCAADDFDVRLLEIEGERATYLAVGCGVVYAYDVSCSRDAESMLVRCRIDGSREVDDDEVDEVLARAKRRQAADAEADADAETDDE